MTAVPTPGGTRLLPPLLLTDPRTAGAAIRHTAGASAQVALVVTQGAIHEGHLSLLRIAREHADFVVASIFVDPRQFGTDEGLEPGETPVRYPRSLEADLETLAGHADAVFAPTVSDMYPDDGAPSVSIDPGPVGRMFEGQTRPGYFSRTLTLIAKIFHLVHPDVAVFGQKDAQLLFLVRRMVRDLNMTVRIVGAELHRDADGVVSSSLNIYLSDGERMAAAALGRAMAAAEDMENMGLRSALSAAQAVLVGEPSITLDYLVAVDPQTFLPVDDDPHGDVLLLVAARVGSTRLLDNQMLYFA